MSDGFKLYEYDQRMAMVRTSSDVENLNTEKIWKKLYTLENDISRIRMTSNNAARQADEAIRKLTGISFGNYIPKHGKEKEHDS